MSQSQVSHVINKHPLSGKMVSTTTGVVRKVDGWVDMNKNDLHDSIAMFIYNTRAKAFQLPTDNKLVYCEGKIYHDTELIHNTGI